MRASSLPRMRKTSGAAGPRSVPQRQKGRGQILPDEVVVRRGRAGRADERAGRQDVAADEDRGGMLGADGGEELLVAVDPAVQVGDEEAEHDATPAPVAGSRFRRVRRRGRGLSLRSRFPLPTPAARASLYTRRRGGHILHGEPHRLEEGDLLRRGAARLHPRHDLADAGPDVVLGDGAFLDGQEDVAGLGQARRLVVGDDRARGAPPRCRAPGGRRRGRRCR